MVALIVMAYVPAGVPGCPLPPEPLPCNPLPHDICNQSIGTINASTRKTSFLLRRSRCPRPPSAMTSPGKESQMAYSGGPNRAERAPRIGAVVVIVNVTCVAPLPLLTCVALSEHELSGGQSSEAVSVTSPGNAPAEGFTSRSKTAGCPAGKDWTLLGGVIVKPNGGGPPPPVVLSIARNECVVELGSVPSATIAKL